MFNYMYSIYEKRQISTQYMLSPNNDILCYLNDEIWKSQAESLDKFYHYCQTNNIELIVLYFPPMNDAITIINGIVSPRLKDYCIARGIKFINLYSYIIDLSTQKRVVNSMDDHPSAEVNKITFKVLLKEIPEFN